MYGTFCRFSAILNEAMTLQFLVHQPYRAMPVGEQPSMPWAGYQILRCLESSQTSLLILHWPHLDWLVGELPSRPYSM